MSAIRKKVLAILPSGFAHAQLALAGVHETARAMHCDVVSAEYGRNQDGGNPVVLRATQAADTVSSLVEATAPDGIIAVCTENLSPSEALKSARRIPVVFVGRPFGLPRSGRFTFVRHETETTAAMAARHLFQTGYDDFAFAPRPGNPPWNHARAEAFRRCVEQSGKRFHPFRDTSRKSAHDTLTARSAILRDWLSALPKPCGILAATDVEGEEVLCECARLGIRVPLDAAVLGIDDSANICESTAPTLSSIALDMHANGCAAMSMLAQWMASPGSGPPEPRTIPPLGITRRASTRICRDRRIAAALEFIRLHACENKFSPRDVVSHMGMGRSRADQLFRAVARRSILGEIHSARLDRACALLLSGKSASFASDTCGFSSIVDFRRVFKRHLGMTVRQWTLDNRHQKPAAR